MRHNSYWPIRVNDQTAVLVKIINKLATYATVLGLAPAQVAGALADAGWLVYILQSWLPAVRSFSKSATDAATAAQTGDGTALQALPVFTPPALPAGVTPVNTGALTRLFNVIQLIKNNPACTDAIADDLGILGTQKSVVDLTTVAPVLKLTLTPTGVMVGWGWEGHAADLDMIELQVDRNDTKGYVSLAFDTTPGYLDTYARPAALTKWKYRGIYRVGENQVGQWSTEQTITVGG